MPARIRTATLLALLALAAAAQPSAAAQRPASVRAPRISGKAVVGQTLSASRGTWSRHPTRFAYAWLRCDSKGGACRTIAGATHARHHVRASELGRRLRVRVRARRGRLSAARRSAPTGRVARPPAAGTTTQPPGANGSSAPPAEGAPSPSSPGSSPPAPGAGMHVSGNKLLNAAGDQVLFHGVNVSGTEYACIQGYGIFDGSSDDAAVAAIRSWNSNTVRVLLNEDCWLGINGVKAAYGGANYRQAIIDFVKRIEAHGMYAEISLMWGAPGSQQATYQPAAPDADHSPTVWAQMAQTWKDDPKVVLAPWGETTVDANCFLNGGNCGADFNGTPYTSAGMQQAVDVMRGNGWGGPIVIPGIDYANNLTQWLSHKPNDPLNQLMAEAHIYGKNTCGTAACMDSQYGPVAAQVPLILGEFGETYDDSSCGATNANAFMNWSDAHDVGYEAWTWNTWGTCGSLISNEDGTPKGTYGNAIKTHLLSRP